MSNQKNIAESVNPKEQNAVYAFKVKIRDREHFYKMVRWLNENVGQGADKWTMGGRVLRSLNRGEPLNTVIYIFKDDFDEESCLYLSLI